MGTVCNLCKTIRACFAGILCKRVQTFLSEVRRLSACDCSSIAFLVASRYAYPNFRSGSRCAHSPHSFHALMNISRSSGPLFCTVCPITVVSHCWYLSGDENAKVLPLPGFRGSLSQDGITVRKSLYSGHLNAAEDSTTSM